MNGWLQLAAPGVAVATPATDGDGILPPTQVVILGGQVITGGELQPAAHSTVTLKVAITELPQSSTAVYIILVKPSGKDVPL